MTRDDIIRMAREAGFDVHGETAFSEQATVTVELMRFAELVAAAERERCAKVCETYADKALEKHHEDWTKTAAICAALIRGTK